MIPESFNKVANPAPSQTFGMPSTDTSTWANYKCLTRTQLSFVSSLRRPSECYAALFVEAVWGHGAMVLLELLNVAFIGQDEQ